MTCNAASTTASQSPSVPLAALPSRTHHDSEIRGAASPVDQSQPQCCHCGYRGSHAPNCPFKS
ncbi:hypothetical protein K474DRAFT_1585337 [Panus rudis PR-1116 ss-1]|nr:hypothetical protein K474DRAFT_1585337 [Panus rudis PR-1116 ss-1]